MESESSLTNSCTGTITLHILITRVKKDNYPIYPVIQNDRQAYYFSHSLIIFITLLSMNKNEFEPGIALEHSSRGAFFNQKGVKSFIFLHKENMLWYSLEESQQGASNECICYRLHHGAQYMKYRNLTSDSATNGIKPTRVPGCPLKAFSYC